MKKSLIAAAIAAGMAAPLAANAGVATYGQMYAGINSIDNDGTATVTQNDNDGRGRMGFKASEELGGGMTAFAKYEFQVDANDAAAAGGCGEITCQRDSFVGIKAGWGAISMGRMHGAYKTAGGVKWDPFVATHLQARGNGGMAKGGYAQNGFISQLVQYKSPKISGVQFQYQTSVLDDGDDNTYTGSEGSNLYSIKYTGVKGLALIYASAKKATAGVADDIKNTKFGAKYKINKKMAVVFQSESAEATSSGAGDYTYLNFSYKAGKHNFVVANGSLAADAADSDVSYFAVGDVIKLSKKSHLTIGYRTTTKETGAATADTDYTSFTVGLRQNF